MSHPLSRFAPSPSLASLREAAGGRPQRGGAALAQGLLAWATPVSRAVRCVMNPL